MRAEAQMRGPIPQGLGDSKVNSLSPEGPNYRDTKSQIAMAEPLVCSLLLRITIKRSPGSGSLTDCVQTSVELKCRRRTSAPAGSGDHPM